MVNLDSYFRRQAARANELSPATVKLMRGSMDLIFGFLPQEIKDWIDGAIQRDTLLVFTSLLGFLMIFSVRLLESLPQLIVSLRMKARLEITSSRNCFSGSSNAFAVYWIVR